MEDGEGRADGVGAEEFDCGIGGWLRDGEEGTSWGGGGRGWDACGSEEGGEVIGGMEGEDVGVGKGVVEFGAEGSAALPASVNDAGAGVGEEGGEGGAVVGSEVKAEVVGVAAGGEGEAEPGEGAEGVAGKDEGVVVVNAG